MAYILRGLHIVIDSEGLHGGVHYEGGWVMEYIVWEPIIIPSSGSAEVE